MAEDALRILKLGIRVIKIKRSEDNHRSVSRIENIGQSQRRLPDPIHRLLPQSGKFRIFKLKTGGQAEKGYSGSENNDSCNP